MLQRTQGHYLAIIMLWLPGVAKCHEAAMLLIICAASKSFLKLWQFRTAFLKIVLYQRACLAIQQHQARYVLIQVSK